MADLPWADIVKDLSEALEQEVDTALRAANRTVLFDASQVRDGVRLSIEVSARFDLPLQPAVIIDSPATAGVQAERDEALGALDQALREKALLAEQVSEAEAARKSAEASIRKLKARIKEIEGSQPPSDDQQAELVRLRATLESVNADLEHERAARLATEQQQADLEELRALLESARAELALERARLLAGDEREAELASMRRDFESMKVELQNERIARASAEANRSFAERERESLLAIADEAKAARQASEQALEQSKQLAADLQAELAELWRAFKEARPSEIGMHLNASDGTRRAGVERVQAKIVDVRELFRRRNHRWPVSI